MHDYLSKICRIKYGWLFWFWKSDVFIRLCTFYAAHLSTHSNWVSWLLIRLLFICGYHCRVISLSLSFWLLDCSSLSLSPLVYQSLTAPELLMRLHAALPPKCSVVICTHLSGKELETGRRVSSVVTSGRLGCVMVITLAWNTRDVGSIPTLGAIFLIFITPVMQVLNLIFKKN